MVDITKRRLMVGGAAAGIMSLVPVGSAFAEATPLHKPQVSKNDRQNLYLDSVSTGYNLALKGKLDVDQIETDDDILNVLRENFETFLDITMESAQAYLLGMDDNTFKSFHFLAKPKRADEGLPKYIQQDIKQYTGNRGFDRESGPQERTGKESTNPLFLRLHDLALAGKISDARAVQYMEVIAERMNTSGLNEALAEIVRERMGTLPNAKPRSERPKF